VHEARIEKTPVGHVPSDDGWFILNLSEMAWETVGPFGTWCVFGSPKVDSPKLGIGVHVLGAGQARDPDQKIHYAVDETAARHGASVAQASDSAAEVYADRPPIAPAPPPAPFA
jgi:hypothetical protein